MERKKKTRTQLAQTSAEKPGRTRALGTAITNNSGTPQSSRGKRVCDCFFFSKYVLLDGYANANGEDRGGGGGGVDDLGNNSVFGSEYRQKAELEKLFVRSMQQIRQKEGATLLHLLGKALSHFFNQLWSPQLPKQTTIPSSHAGETVGILVNDANSFLSL
ncbi:uncharacterized protein MONOS_9707 [Monocercomonoides exilis]|uniref:uncharacterized protein n=1 Tax=Monocercomonoides exilis TaxID=2049356 RepID=UPI003559BE36|nr:hypothetical protein MONOS_9707 [Monocercomonoides exilis]|eukprot:MONOS_9707.1-p1 / transcript=MONOS_9707.1 / gene=MONOS_9707 / organism=Monocercomonoides_exilis_PA203 / gene_product=unspecified product / transcript_product=unspecified product / location=Mono_scaffold00411:7549-8099(+) / protein_length=161 / sequence_SO=supercontig / SO=protein_coding / is_pseudo=false